MPTSELSQPSVPFYAQTPQLLEPKYQNLLRIAGRTLDENDLEEVILVEIEDGFFLRPHSQARVGYMTETFTDDRLMETLRVAIYSRGEPEAGAYRSPLWPTGEISVERCPGVLMTTIPPTPTSFLQFGPSGVFRWFPIVLPDVTT